MQMWVLIVYQDFVNIWQREDGNKYFDSQKASSGSSKPMTLFREHQRLSITYFRAH